MKSFTCSWYYISIQGRI